MRACRRCKPEVSSSDPAALTLALSQGERGRPADRAVGRVEKRLQALRPLGACLAFRGVEGAIPFLHGSQGCSTYIRRYMISHFKEPLDIASSNFSEATAIFGGEANLREGLANVVRQYAPRLIGIASTCLAETIGDDVAFYLRQIRAEAKGDLPRLVHVSTPSYAGTHAEGFCAAVRALVEALAEPGPRHPAINVLPGIVSPADLRYLKGLFRDFGLEAIVLPDYSDTLDGPVWDEYQTIPRGGTPIEAICRMGSARATIEFGSTGDRTKTAGALLEERFGVPRYELPPPIGVIANRPAHRRAVPACGTAAAGGPRGRTGPADRLVRRRPQIRFRQACRGLWRAGPRRGVGRAVGRGGHGAGHLRVGGQNGPPPRDRGRRRASRKHNAAHGNEGEPGSEMTVLEGVDFTEIEAHAAAAADRFGHRQQQGLWPGAAVENTAHSRRLSHPRPRGRAAADARRLSRRAAVVRSDRQRGDRRRPRCVTGGL